MDLYLELQTKIKDLETSVKTLRKTGQDYATAYTDYRIKLAKELLRLKSEGTPVTIAYDIARGTKEVASAKYNEICKEAIYKANLEAINATKLEIKIIQNQLDKEYSNGTAD